MRRSVVFFLVFLVMAGGGGIALSTIADTPEDSDDINRILQSAVLTGLDGTEVTLSDYEGKTVLIDIWETWCTPCLRSFPTLQQLMDDYPDDFIVLAVSPGYMDSPEDVRAFVDNNPYRFEFLFGEELSQNLGVHSLPYKVYVSPSGEYITTKLGSQGPEEDYEKTREIIEEYL